MATVMSRQPEVPPSPKSPTFLKNHSRRPSIQISAWLSRNSGQGPASPALKTTQISDPQPINPLDAAARAPGALGAGATVVRTPQQALTVKPFPLVDTPNEKDELDLLPVVDISPPVPRETAPLVISRRESPAPRQGSPSPGRNSPAGRDSPILRGPAIRSATLPPGLRSLHTSKSYSHLQSGARMTTASLPPHRTPPMPLSLVSSSRQPLLRSALRPPSPTKSSSGSISSFLPLLPPPRQSPKDVSPPSPLSPFHPVLLSGVPTQPMPLSQIIVTLETSTISQRTTVATLTSRPSRLASFLQALVPAAADSPTSQSFAGLFAAHLAQAGLGPQGHSGQIHIFLDRPSTPYAHILTYLRSGSNTPGMLPRAASLALSADPIRVEALCELRDEARYLELTELVELCEKELRARAPKLKHTASSSSLREYKFGSGSDGTGARISSGSEGIESRLKEYKFGNPAVESLREEEGEEDGSGFEGPPPIVYEKKGSHAGVVLTVPPRGMQQTSSIVGHSRSFTRLPAPQGRTRTTSEVRYTQSPDGRKWF